MTPRLRVPQVLVYVDREVPKEVIKYVEKEVIKYVDRPVEKVKEVRVEVPKEVIKVRPNPPEPRVGAAA